MVNHHIAMPAAAETVTFVMGHFTVAETKTHETDYHIVGLDEKRIVGNADTIAGSGLSGYRHIRIFKPQGRFQENSAVDIKNDCPRAGLIAGIAE